MNRYLVKSDRKPIPGHRASIRKGIITLVPTQIQDYHNSFGVA